MVKQQSFEDKVSKGDLKKCGLIILHVLMLIIALHLKERKVKGTSFRLLLISEKKMYLK